MTSEARKLALLTAAGEFCDRPARAQLQRLMDAMLDVFMNEPRPRGVEAWEDGPQRKMTSPSQTDAGAAPERAPTAEEPLGGIVGHPEGRGRFSNVPIDEDPYPPQIKPPKLSFPHGDMSGVPWERIGHCQCGAVYDTQKGHECEVTRRVSAAIATQVRPQADFGRLVPRHPPDRSPA